MKKIIKAISLCMAIILVFGFVMTLSRYEKPVNTSANAEVIKTGNVVYMVNLANLSELEIDTEDVGVYVTNREADDMKATAFTCPANDILVNLPKGKWTITIDVLNYDLYSFDIDVTGNKSVTEVVKNITISKKIIINRILKEKISEVCISIPYSIEFKYKCGSYNFYKMMLSSHSSGYSLFGYYHYYGSDGIERENSINHIITGSFQYTYNQIEIVGGLTTEVVEFLKLFSSDLDGYVYKS